MTKRTLILGCGYVGQALAEEALQSGFEVIAVTRNLETLADLNRLGCQVVAAQVESDTWHAQATGEFDLAINCVSSAGNGLEGYRQSYVGGNHSFVAWLNKVSVGRAIFTSSVSVYPDSGGEWVSETDAAPNNDRGKIILEAENIFLNSDVSSTRKCILRLGGIYGPQRHMLLNKSRLAPEEIPGIGTYYLNLIRLEDICSSIWSVYKCAALEGRSIFNVVDDDPVFKLDLVNWFADQLGHPRPRFIASKNPNNSSRRFAGESPSNRRIRNCALKKKCNWEPRFHSFKEGFSSFLKEVDV
ncbi:NAD(P)H-binding protein [Puniceicoccaceae bacterium K14]|nr:NAD(P)H-binding protein [Puniceicoccaceae bacterium K14]